MKIFLSRIKNEISSLKEERNILNEETDDLLKVIAGNKRRVAEIEGRIDELRESEMAAKHGDKYALHLAGEV